MLNKQRLLNWLAAEREKLAIILLTATDEGFEQFSGMDMMVVKLQMAIEDGEFE